MMDILNAFDYQTFRFQLINHAKQNKLPLQRECFVEMTHNFWNLSENKNSIIVVFY